MGGASQAVQTQAAMKVLSLIFALVVSTISEWTCDDCAEASVGLAAFVTSPEAYQFDIDILVTAMCPEAEDPAGCEEHLPGLFTAIADIIFNEHYKYICDDLEECKMPTLSEPKASLPYCGECFERINGATDALGWDTTLQAWVEAFEAFQFCEYYAPDAVPECKEAVTAVIEVGLPILGETPRDWISQFCGTWGCLEE